MFALASIRRTNHDQNDDSSGRLAAGFLKAGVWDGAGVVWAFWAGTFWMQMAKAKVRSAMKGVENAWRMVGPPWGLDATARGWERDIVRHIHCSMV